MSLGPHYYLLILGADGCRLFEAFRDFLIDIENRGFPVETPAPVAGADRRRDLQELAVIVDRRLGHHHDQEPLPVVVVGEPEMQSAFLAVTAHADSIAGRIEEEHANASMVELGRIAWPLIRQAMSGNVDRALRDLASHTRSGCTASGLDSIARLLDTGSRNTLLVEEGYRVRGSIGATGRGSALSAEVDVRDTLDDVVDAVIEKVLQLGGNVVFTPDGSLTNHSRIVLLINEEDKS